MSNFVYVQRSDVMTVQCRAELRDCLLTCRSSSCASVPGSKSIAVMWGSVGAARVPFYSFWGRRLQLTSRMVDPSNKRFGNLCFVVNSVMLAMFLYCSTSLVHAIWTDALCTTIVYTICLDLQLFFLTRNLQNYIRKDQTTNRRLKSPVSKCIPKHQLERDDNVYQLIGSWRWWKELAVGNLNSFVAIFVRQTGFALYQLVLACSGY
jgi:hypothetical protein